MVTLEVFLGTEITVAFLERNFVGRFCYPVCIDLVSDFAGLCQPGSQSVGIEREDIALGPLSDFEILLRNIDDLAVAGSDRSHVDVCLVDVIVVGQFESVPPAQRLVVVDDVVLLVVQIGVTNDGDDIQLGVH